MEEDFDPKLIYCNPNISESLKLMPQASSLPLWKSTICPLRKDLKNECLIISHNVQGILPHYADIKDNNLLKRFDVMALQETWLSRNNDVSGLFEGYNILRVDRHRGNETEQKRGNTCFMLYACSIA